MHNLGDKGGNYIFKKSFTLNNFHVYLYYFHLFLFIIYIKKYLLSIDYVPETICAKIVLHCLL